jgi:hypothetical protein
MLVGTVLDRMRFDVQRTAVLTRYEQALREWKTYRMAFEKDAALIRQAPQTSASRPGRVERAHPITLNLPQ